MNSLPDWAASSQQWAQAMQSFGGLAQGMPMPQLPSMPDFPQITFDPQKLETLQQAYIKEAAELWNASLVPGIAKQDKRFASDAWGQNPLAAYFARRKNDCL